MSLRDRTYAELKRHELSDDSDWHRDVYKPKRDALLIKDTVLLLQDRRNYVVRNRVVPI